MWGKNKHADRDNTDHDDMTVVFHPKGGFNKNGAFTEGNSTEEYQKQGYLTLDVVCKKLSYARTWGLEKEYGEEDEFSEVRTEVLGGDGKIKRSHYGQYAFSFLGTKAIHTSLGISIRKAEEKHISIVPMKATSDMDLAWDEHFSLDIRLDENSFIELRDELRANPNFTVLITVRLDRMQGLYTTWSPSISEGRTLKVLDREEDVSNHKEMPDTFKAVGFGGDRLPFSISVGELPQDDTEDEITADL